MAKIVKDGKRKKKINTPSIYNDGFNSRMPKPKKINLKTRRMA